MGRGKHRDRGHKAKRARWASRNKGEERRTGGTPRKHTKRNVKSNDAMGLFKFSNKK